ncbi:hypothetical protein PS662_03085 [Pseudomonas fluorescens]|uniref:Glycosyltransferase RgtA/B/C/D-like domain-containing protein n=2 Tax=Pseudomonas fluorescens TaxID=294 RepID=A0A5E6NZ90_PSEFL|nr:hypothetical protein PS662_00042 [Pseudomonas fluorescens]VVM95967.1 hypothetical protein PS662_03085 [Pseudomonas fluorescens]
MRLKFRQLKLTENVFVCGAILAFVVFGFIWNKRYQFLGWDEFSHWALVAKYLIAENRLFTADSQIMFLAYPPGTALFQYYFAQVMGAADGTILFAHMSLLAAAVLALVSNSARKPLVAISILMVCFVVIYGLGYDIYEIYVDLILGALLGAAVAILLAKKSDIRGYLIVIPMLMFLPLVKHVGFAFALVGLGAMVVAAVFDCRTLPSRQQRIRIAACVFAAIAGVAFTQLSWHSYYLSLGVTDPYARVMTISNVLEFFINPTSDKHVAVWAEFWQRILPADASSGVSLISPALEALILVVLTGIHVWLLPTAIRVRQLFIFSIVAAGLVAFSCLLLLSYGFYFSDYESVRLASFERYFGSYLLAWGFALAGAAGQQIAVMQRSRLVSFVMLPLLLMVFVLIPKVHAAFFTDEGKARHQELSGLRDISRQLSIDIRSVAKPNQKTYFIDPYSTGYTFFMFRYEMAPMVINTKCWVLRVPVSKDDIYACDLPLDAALDGYDFLALGKVDAEFWVRYGSWFAPADQGISPASFAVARDGGTLRLKRLKSE